MRTKKRKKCTHIMLGLGFLAGALAAGNVLANPSNQLQQTQEMRMVAKKALQKPAILSQYSHTANRLSLAQLQTALLAERAKQVNYQLSITKDDHEIKKLLTPPHRPIFVVKATPNKAVVTVLPTQVNWVMKRNGQWKASVNVNGQAQTINNHSRLSNGSRVLNINSNGVLLEKQGRRHFIKVSE